MTTRLEEIKARLAAATPGPWQQTHGKVNDELPVYWDIGKYGGHDQEEGRMLLGRERNAQADSAFIANAPEDIAWLVGEVERLRCVLSAVAGDGANIRYGGCEHVGAHWELSNEQKRIAKEALE